MKGWPDWRARWTSNWRAGLRRTGGSAEILVQIGRFAVLLAKDDFTVNQVEQLVVVGRPRREFSEKGLD